MEPFSASRLWNLHEFPKVFQKILSYSIIGIVKIGKCSDQLLSKPGNRFLHLRRLLDLKVQ